MLPSLQLSISILRGSMWWMLCVAVTKPSSCWNTPGSIPINHGLSQELSGLFFKLPSATNCQYQTCRPHSLPLLMQWIYFTAGTGLGLGRTPPSPSSSRHLVIHHRCAEEAPTAGRRQTGQQLSPVQYPSRNTVSLRNVEVLFSFRTEAAHNLQKLVEGSRRKTLELFNNYQINVLFLIP